MADPVRLCSKAAGKMTSPFLPFPPVSKRNEVHDEPAPEEENMKMAKTAPWLLALSLCIPAHGGAHEQHGLDENTAKHVFAERLGEVKFPVTCNTEAQEEFNRAMALFHSFWFDPATRSFRKALRHDAGCGMASWGIAMMSLGNPFTWPASPKAWEAGAAALADARRVSAGSERERDYIAALNVLFRDWKTMDYRPRVLAFEKEMERLAARYPDDTEAQILYALVLNATALPADKTFGNQLKAADILEPLFRKYPRHPGVAHYLIHTYDYAGLAERGLPAAREYAAIAPSVPHALHMPSHIFSRVGLWHEMVMSNQASYRAARDELKEATLGIGAYDALHAMDYMVFGHLQQAQDRAARQLVDETFAIRKVTVENLPAAYALAAIPARFALERGDWKGAAALGPLTAELAWTKFPQAEAILVFARGLGSARSGNTEAARNDMARLEALKVRMTEAKLDYWAGQADFQIKTVRAWVAFEANRPDEAIRLMHEAADAEEASDKHPVTPGNVATCRQLLGEMLLELDRPTQALAEFERSLKRDPNRFRSLYGAGRAAEMSGDREAARDYYTRLQAVTADRDSARPELIRAEAFLGKGIVIPQ